MSTPSTTPAPLTTRPWLALGAICVGFFMILVDMTIVAVAQPKIQTALHTDFNGVIWVTSAYLLTYAVPLLITGRLGDRFGPKRILQMGLVVFTAASLWCGLADSIGELIAARAVQGLGAALITPQTMAVITRIFPAEKRGAAMGVWGTVAGVATLVGPLLGGILTDSFGWAWIFFVNLPVGIVGIVLAQMFVPRLPTRNHSFDYVGVLLSAVGMSALVFGIQDGEKYHWAGWIWALIIGGVVVMGLFIFWQSKIKSEPLVPLSLFRDLNFTLANIGISAMGFAVAGMMVPSMFFLQLVGGMSPTQSALMMVPMAIATGILAPIVGRIVDRIHPRIVIGSSLALMALSLAWLAVITAPATPVWQLLIPNFLMGVASAGIWAPLAATATRNLPMSQAGAGAGVYNTTRMIGSVLGSAAVGALLQTRLTAEMPKGLPANASSHISGQLPEFIRGPFASAMSQTLFLPAAIMVIGVVAALFFQRPRHMSAAPARPAVDQAPDASAIPAT